VEKVNPLGSDIPTCVSSDWAEKLVPFLWGNIEKIGKYSFLLKYMMSPCSIFA
jgi:hypothetical protein